MNISESGINLIKGFEEFVDHPYLDSVGKPTIGYGTTYYPNGKPVTMQDPTITESIATDYLMLNIAPTVDILNQSLLTANLTQNQFDACCSISYNIGDQGFHGSTLRRLINANPNDPNITAAFMMWDKGHVDGELVVLPGLDNRRKAEAAYYFS